MSDEQAYQELLTLSREASLMGSCGSVLGWDERTYMPPKGSAHRAEQMALLARLTHEKSTHPRIGELLDRLEQSHQAGDANVRELRRIYDRAVKLPSSLVEELARTTTRAQQVWQEAKQQSDFPAFCPWLEKLAALKRQEAAAVGYRESPYDALLDEYEPGATASQVREVFATVRDALTPLVAAIAASGRQAPVEILSRSYPVDKQQAFSREFAARIGFDFDAGRLDETAHPFCSSFGPRDCRLTTRYNPRHFNEAFFGTLHEAGHGMYEQGLPAEHYGTPLGWAASLGIHESQSRLWENQVGRSRAFWEFAFPRAQQTFPDALGRVRLDDWLLAINDVRPSFIRIEADEVTYNLHIILRFELEQALVSGDLQAADVPAAWRDKFAAAFGMTPPTDAQGCLQDIHWSMGGIGYFPTYTLGNLYAAQWMEQARQDLGDLDAAFREGDFAGLKSWLREKIHARGQRSRAGELCERVTGKKLSPLPFLNYLKSKFGPLYGI